MYVVMVLQRWEPAKQKDSLESELKHNREYNTNSYTLLSNAMVSSSGYVRFIQAKFVF